MPAVRARWLAFALLVTALAESAPVRADYIRFLMEFRREGDRRVLVLRQVPDYSHGFDQYFLEELAVPANSRLSQDELGGKDRGLLVATGQWEVYRKRVDAALEKESERFRERGYVALCRPVPAPLSSLVESRLMFGKVELALKIEPGRFSEVTLGLGDQVYRLLRFPALPAGVAVGHRGLREVVLLDQGRVLGVVVRSQLVPAPANEAGDAPYFFPLKRASAKLGFELPLTAECIPEGGKGAGQEGAGTEGGGK